MASADNYTRGLGLAGDMAEAGPPPPAERIIEALLFAGGQPLTAELASQTIRGMDAPAFKAVIDELNRQYRRQARPFVIQSRPEGYVFALKSGFDALRERLTAGPRAAKLTVPQLDVLAAVAYKQPVTRSEVDALRGADSAAILRQLVRLGLIAIQDNVPGVDEPAFNTTPRFLEVFGVRSLDDLPRTDDLQKI
jgi:segregation and condensation protein B